MWGKRSLIIILAALVGFAAGAGEPSATKYRLDLAGTAGGKVLSEDPLIVEYEGFFSRDECEHFLSSVKPRLRLPGGPATPNNARYTAALSHNQDKTVWCMTQRVANLVGVPSTQAERLRVVRYLPDTMDNGPHYDARHHIREASMIDEAKGGQRLISALWYLDDVDGGGDTEFTNLDIRVSPKQGKLLIFHNTFPHTIVRHPKALHHGMRVTQGEKHLVTWWFRDLPIMGYDAERESARFGACDEEAAAGNLLSTSATPANVVAQTRATTTTTETPKTTRTSSAPAASSKSTSPQSHECPTTTKQATFVSDQSSFTPAHSVAPLLWSAPGSGNTWTRLLIERATGVLTGSLYNDHHLERILLGNNRCMKDTVVVKAHPMHCGSKCMDDISSSAVAFKKCGPEMQEAGLDVKEFGNKAVILLREPFRAIWSDFQRSINLNSRVDHHRMKINRTSLLQNQFFWDKWVSTAHRQAAAFLGAMNTYRTYVKEGHEAVVVTYERLLDESTRTAELGKILSFLGSGWADSDLACAFEDPQTKMSLRPKSQEDAEAATLVDAYPVSLACELWSKWLKYSVPQGQAIGVDLSGYTIIHDYTCFDEAKDTPLSQQQLRKISSIEINSQFVEPTARHQPLSPPVVKSSQKTQVLVDESSFEPSKKRISNGADYADDVESVPAASADVQKFVLDYELKSSVAAVRDDFQRRQNPVDCAAAKYLIFRPGGSGFGSQLHIFGTQACTAMSLGRILVPLTRLGDRNWLWNDAEFCARNPGPECYFERITQCDDFVRAQWRPTEEAKASAYKDWDSDRQFVYIEGGPWVPEMKPRTEAGIAYCTREFGGNAWKVPIVATMTQPNDRLRSWLESGINEFLLSVTARHPSITKWPPHDKVISVAIRWGDKIVDSDLHAISRYVKAVRHVIDKQNIQLPVVFVSSEDETAIQAFREATEGLGWIVLWHEHSRCFQPESHDVYNYSRLQDPANEHDTQEAIISARGENFQGQYKLFAGRGWSNCLSPNNRLNIPGGPPRVALMSLLNAYIAAEATQTVYTSSSNWGRFILETKQSREMTPGVVYDLDAKRNGGQKGSHHRSHLL